MTDDADAPGRDRPALAERRDLDSVYQPAEDSALLAETVTERIDEGDRALDLGTGTGFVGAALRDAGATVVAADLNPLACRRARDRDLPVVRGDLVAPFRDGTFDVVAFNPPYLPTPAGAEWDDWMTAALSGGEDGRAVVEPFLDTVGRVLAPGGRALLLVSSLTDVDAVREYARERGFDAAAVAAEKHPYERLVVLELPRQQRPDDSSR